MLRFIGFGLLVLAATPAAATSTISCTAKGSVGMMSTRNAGDAPNAGCNLGCDFTLENGNVETAVAGPFNVAKNKREVERYRNDFGMKIKRVSRPQMACR